MGNGNVFAEIFPYHSSTDSFGFAYSSNTNNGYNRIYIYSIMVEKSDLNLTSDIKLVQDVSYDIGSTIINSLGVSDDLVVLGC